jgi:hypothetical protein
MRVTFKVSKRAIECPDPKEFANLAEYASFLLSKRTMGSIHVNGEEVQWKDHTLDGKGEISYHDFAKFVDPEGYMAKCKLFKHQDTTHLACNKVVFPSLERFKEAFPNAMIITEGECDVDLSTGVDEFEALMVEGYYKTLAFAKLKKKRKKN